MWTRHELYHATESATADQRLQQEVGKSLCGALPVLRLLQFCENPQHAPRYARNEIWPHGSRLDMEGIT